MRWTGEAEGTVTDQKLERVISQMHAGCWVRHRTKTVISSFIQLKWTLTYLCQVSPGSAVLWPIQTSLRTNQVPLNRSIWYQIHTQVHMGAQNPATMHQNTPCYMSGSHMYIVFYSLLAWDEARPMYYSPKHQLLLPSRELWNLFFPSLPVH